MEKNRRGAALVGARSGDPEGRGEPGDGGAAAAGVGRSFASLRTDLTRPRASNQIRFGEEEADLLRRVLGRIASVDRVALDVGAVEIANGSRIGLLRIGRAHRFAQMRHGVGALESR